MIRFTSIVLNRSGKVVSVKARMGWMSDDNIEDYLAEFEHPCPNDILSFHRIEVWNHIGDECGITIVWSWDKVWTAVE